ncbi:MAG: 16S rRNA (cytosine(1402)-N(4))-methyltransferase RsmH [Firmicutes bacterium]|nr:16S rRNA (cytosine(1402)-N(4))-methyltransferase RsmH [Bacillota bacterium]
MSELFAHETVLPAEAVMALKPRAGGVYVDATMGGGGHTRRLLDESAPDGIVIGVDQDERAIAHAEIWGRAFGRRLVVMRANFASLSDVLSEIGVARVDGLLMDLGVSSVQLDEADRGFSYQHDAPLDMRMDRRQRTSARTLLAELSERQITQILREYGEEKWASRIAAFIVRQRVAAPLETTGQLVDLIKAAIPASARRDGPHPAKRSFQALRIAVNRELDVLADVLVRVPDVLAPGGRIAVISFHSLEDRAVKQAFARAVKPCTCPPQQPVCTCHKVPTLRLVTRKPIEPTADEVAGNPRARSAKMRVAERL